LHAHVSRLSWPWGNRRLRLAAWFIT
jgi:hypothetical protein